LLASGHCLFSSSQYFGLRITVFVYFENKSI